MNRRHHVWLAVALLAAGARGSVHAQAPAPVSVVVVAQRFAFDRQEIKVARGQVLDLELHARDVLHGFSVPALGVRSDIVPGRAAHLRIVARTPGRYVFLCDVFCGDGHARMAGVLIVTE